MICPKCGSENISGTNFCVHCGADLKTVQTSVNTNNNIPENNFQSQYNSSSELEGNNGSKFDIRKLLPIVALVALLIIGFVVYKFFFSNNKTGASVSKLFDQKQPILVKKDGKYGYINTEGKFIIEPQYESASSFAGEYAVVETKLNGEEVYQIIDKKGNVKASSEYYSGIEYIEDYDVWVINSQLYDGSLKKITSDDVMVDYEGEGYLSWENYSKGTAGIMNTSGKITYTYKYAEGESYLSIDPSENDYSLKQRYCRVNVENEKYAIVNCDTGKVAYNFTDKYISDEDDNIFEISEHNDNYDFIAMVYIHNDKVAYKSEKESIDLSYESEGYLQIRDDDKDYSERYSYYDLSTGKIVKEEPSSSLSFNFKDEWEEFTGLNSFSCDNGEGLMKGDSVVLSCDWDDIDYLGVLLYQYLKSEGKDYILAEKNDKTYIVNLKDGKIVNEFNTSYIYDDEFSPFIYYKDSDTDKYIVYNLLTGKTLETSSDNNVYTGANYVVIKEDNVSYYYNNKMKLIYTEK